MKIGIVTFWQSEDNYGEVLQCYALYKWLELKGHNCFIIRYKNEVSRDNISRFFTFLSLLKSPKKLLSALFTRRKGSTKVVPNSIFVDRHFSDFRNKEFNNTPVLSKEELIKNSLGADAYVCGSDQIWGSNDPIMYLAFAEKTSYKIAFAPSFGGLVPNYYVRRQIKDYLKSFDIVSCRERSGVELCHSIGIKNACLFPDPTMMHDSSFYSMISKRPSEKKEYIFLYMLGNKSDFNIDEVYRFAEVEGLKVVFVTGQSRLEDNYPLCYPTIEEWIGYVQNAKYVVTNSFHGTVFSLLFHKRFITIPLSGEFSRMNVRINDLLNDIKLSNRIYHNNIEIVKDFVDFQEFDHYRLKNYRMVDNLLTKLEK